MNSTLQDIMGLLNQRMIKVPTDKDYMVIAGLATRGVLTPQPKLQPSVITLGSLKEHILSSTTLQQVTTAGSTTTNTITINKADGLQALVITGDAAANGLIQVTASDGPCIKASTTDGSSIIGATDAGSGVSGTATNGTGVTASCNNAGSVAIVVDGGSFGTGVKVVNGGVNILGLENPITTYQLSLSLNSAAKPSTNTWTVTSDARVKTNINPYTKGLETILAINPVTYDYNGKAGFDPTIIGNIGIIAQDVLNIIPESINTYQSKLNEDDEEKTELYNFDSHALTFILINAVKQLSAEIELLKTQLT